MDTLWARCEIRNCWELQDGRKIWLIAKMHEKHNRGRADQAVSRIQQLAWRKLHYQGRYDANLCDLPEYVNSVTVYPDKVVAVFNFFPSMGFEAHGKKQAYKNTECAESAHSHFLTKYDLWDLLTYRLKRSEIYNYEVSNLLYRRLRTDRPRPPQIKSRAGYPQLVIFFDMLNIS